MRLGKVKERSFGVLASFRLRYPDASGFFKPAPSPKDDDRRQPMIGTTRQNSKILAPARLQFFCKRSKN